MKKKFLLLTVMVFINIACSAESIIIPKTIKEPFSAKFPGAKNVKWEKENSKEVEAEFKFNDKDVSANFGLDGAWKETETKISESDLPGKVHDAISKKCPYTPITMAEKIERPASELVYEVLTKMKNKKLNLT